MTTDVPAMIKIKPARRFLRFDRLFNDAVRSKRRSAIVEVLLRVQLSADNARRTAEKARAWAAEHGAQVAETPSEVGARCEVVITMVVDGAQVESVLLAEGAGAANAALDDALFVDMSTIGPNAARRIASRLSDRGAHFMDAPVTGSSPKAEDGTLTIMARKQLNDQFDGTERLPDAALDIKRLPIFGKSGLFYQGETSAAYLHRNFAIGSNAKRVPFRL